MTDSEIIYNAKGEAVCFVGEDAVHLFRAAALASAMLLYKAGMTQRGMSGAQALKEAKRYTGKDYKRGQYDQARADLQVWCAEMKSALPQSERPS